MSPDEIEDFLSEQHTLIVASHGHTGHPHLVPMWFAFLDSAIVFWTYGSAQKTVNLRRDARMSCLVEAGESYEELRGVFLEGHAHLSEDPAEIQRVGEAIAQRYGGGPLDESGREAIRSKGGKRVAVVFESTRVVSWDHRKLGPGVY